MLCDLVGETGSNNKEGWDKCGKVLVQSYEELSFKLRGRAGDISVGVNKEDVVEIGEKSGEPGRVSKLKESGG